MRKVAVVGTVVLGMAGTVALSAPVSAAPKCWVGSWKVASASADISTPTIRFKFKGGKDIKLKFDKAGKASYDFTRAKPFEGSGTVSGLPTTAKLKLAKKMTMLNTVTGSAKGKITGKPKTAKGTATLTVQPKVGVTQTINIVSTIKKHQDLGVLPRQATYTCKGKILTIKQRIKEKDLTATTFWKFRRA